MNKRVANNKASYDDVKGFIESKGCELLSEVYITNKNNLDIKCSCGNIFSRSFSKFKNSKRYYCTVCSGKNKYDYDYALNIITNDCRLNPKYKFINSNKKQLFECVDCGKEIEAYPRTLIKNKIQPCDNCNSDFVEYNLDGVIKYIEENSNCIVQSKEYTSSKSKIKLKCSCGNMFETTFSKFKNRNKRQCNECSNSYTLTYEEVKLNIEKTGNKLITKIDSYKNSRSILEIKCRLCGDVYENSHTGFMVLKYKTCKKCSDILNGEEQRFSHEYVYSFIKENNCELLSKYIKSNLNIDIRCSCGEVFNTTFNQFNSSNKRRCNKCSNVISNGELFLMEWLNDNNIKYQHQKKFKNCVYKYKLPFDFYLSDYNCCIEVDGVAHRKYIDYFHKTKDNFEKCKLRDSIKDKYCDENNIKLYRIKYDTLEDIKEWIYKHKHMFGGVI